MTLGNGNYAIDGTNTNITLTPYQNRAVQQWLLISNADGSVIIKNALTG